MAIPTAESSKTVAVGPYLGGRSRTVDTSPQRFSSVVEGGQHTNQAEDSKCYRYDETIETRPGADPRRDLGEPDGAHHSCCASSASRTRRQYGGHDDRCADPRRARQLTTKPRHPHVTWRRSCEHHPVAAWWPRARRLHDAPDGERRPGRHSSIHQDFPAPRAGTPPRPWRGASPSSARPTSALTATARTTGPLPTQRRRHRAVLDGDDRSGTPRTRSLAFNPVLNVRAAALLYSRDGLEPVVVRVRDPDRRRRTTTIERAA